MQISETETPLHRHETVYRRIVERLSTPEQDGGALRGVLDAWFYALDEDVLAEGAAAADDDSVLAARSNDARSSGASARSGGELPPSLPRCAAYRRALAEGRRADADGLLSWLGGQPHVAAQVKRAAGIRGDIDHDAALGFLQGLLRRAARLRPVRARCRARRGRDACSASARTSASGRLTRSASSSTRSTRAATPASRS